MGTTKVLKIVGLILAVGQLISCKQAERSFSTEEETAIELASEEVANPSIPGGVIVPPPIGNAPPAPMLPPKPQDLSKIPPFCSAFIRATPVEIDMTATNDEIIPASGQNITIEKARTVRLSSGGGSIAIRSAITILPFNTGGGDISINAMTIKAVTMSGGSRVCLHANHIESIVATGGGEQTIVAGTVASLSPGPGTVHLFGSTVKLLANGNAAGVLCLHEGAEVEKMNNYEVTGDLGNGCYKIEM